MGKQRCREKKMRAQASRLMSVFTALLAVAFPLAAQQFTGQAGTGVLTPAATVDPLHPSAAKTLALATPDTTRQRGPRRLHPNIFAPAISAQLNAASTAAQT